MTDSKSISIATSLVPGRDIELQSLATKSWRAHGFQVTALNAASEIANVRKQFPDSLSIAAERTAEKAVGKPLPFVIDLLRTATAQNPTARVIGFLNSDILLRSQCDLARILIEHASSAAILLPRVDISDIRSAEGYRPTGQETYSIGYDGIFCHPICLPVFPTACFVLACRSGTIGCHWC